jgi:hypothetical protein
LEEEEPDAAAGAVSFSQLVPFERHAASIESAAVKSEETGV